MCSEVDPLPAALDSYGKMFAQRVNNSHHGLSDAQARESPQIWP